MELKCTKDSGRLVVAVKGRMDAVTAPDFEKGCAAEIDRGEKDMIVDLGGLEYISSAGLRAILSTAKRLKAAGGGIRFCSLKGMVQEVFTVSGFSSMFPIHDALDEALKD
ncbi:MAG: STAS domain-containing protein [Desulfovibrionaceae bacterium]|nr:STAS domain-containing protein [Desulfovibrionaceae bacterium]MDD4952753.1 STAS domain-containing protein [Desulfovibrionaceae bacterium]